MRISIPLYNTLKKYEVKVPSLVTGIYNGLKLSIKLPTWNLEISISGRHCKVKKTRIFIML